MNSKKLVVIRLMLIMMMVLAPLSSPITVQAHGPDLAPDVLSKPTNIACLPFAQSTMTSYNGGDQDGPYTSDADQTFITWRDDSDSETEYRVERRTGGGSWTEIATIAADEISYLDTGLDENETYRYRVRAAENDDFGPYSDVCRKPSFVDSDEGNFRIFYRTTDCPDVLDEDDNVKTVCVPATTDSDGENEVAARMVAYLEANRDELLNLGFNDPLANVNPMPIDLIPCDGVGCARGGTTGYITLSPSSMIADYDPMDQSGQTFIWTNLHELFHKQQGIYGGLDDPTRKWVSEGQARSIQDKICITRVGNNCTFSLDQLNSTNYRNDVQEYLDSPNWSITETSYNAALFWTYLLEQYGTETEEPQLGIDFMKRFWELSEADPGHDGITLINMTLADYGSSDTFRDVFKNFAVANYAKEVMNAPAKYRYIDEGQTPGSYGAVALALNSAINIGDQLVDTDETVYPWAANYYEVQPAANLPFIDITVTQDTNVPLYFTVLGIKGNDIAYEQNVEAEDFSLTLVNNNYDRVVLIVVGLENLANYRYDFNLTQPVINVLNPTTQNPALVGAKSSPDKFPLAVEVLGPDLAPLEGVSSNDFSFRVGNEDVAADEILTSAQAQGVHLFVLRAPEQTDPATEYDLIVSYGNALSATETLAIDYTPREDADNMVILDRSGSMADNDKLVDAKIAAKLFVDSWREGDQIGVVTFNTNTDVALGLTPWTDAPNGGSRQDAFDEIDAPNATGGTAIGKAVRDGWDELVADGEEDHDWAITLLSDALETDLSDPLDDVIEDLLDTTDKRPVVNTIAIGADADRPRMQQIADDTGGLYLPISEPTAARGIATNNQFLLDVYQAYRFVATKVVGQQQFFEIRGPQNDGNHIGDVIPLVVESGADELVVSLSWDGDFGPTGPDNELRDPDNKKVPIFKASSDHHVWRVDAPQGGTWTLYVQPRIEGRGASQMSEELLPPYYVQAAVRSDVNMFTYLTTPVEDRATHVPMPILVSLTDAGPIVGATVNAEIQIPGGATFNLPFFDDGAHDDGAANDGIYGATFYGTNISGSYFVTVEAEGVSPLSGPFKRHDILGFFLPKHQDKDKDGLPDPWEEEHDLDPTRPDSEEDPDNDGLTSGRELALGTNPNDPDTDNGGENDGSEVARGANPLTPSDDGIQPPRIKATGLNGRVDVKLTRGTRYTKLHIYRTSSGRQANASIIVDWPTDNEWVDEKVTNDQTYCYQFAAANAANAVSNLTDIQCVTPQVDPHAPIGYVTIPPTASANVTLILFASDSPTDHEHEEPGEEEDHIDAHISGVAEMMIANDSDFSGATWEPYQTSKAWTLQLQGNTAVVYAKFRDGAGNESDVAQLRSHVAVRTALCTTRSFCAGTPASASTSRIAE
ncbi:MAG: choice-of-anchor X domain-containing protein, partial [Chloroflexota bacterium]